MGSQTFRMARRNFGIAFVLHPVVRCFLNPRYGGNVYVMLTEYLVISIAAAWLLTKLLNFIPKPKL